MWYCLVENSTSWNMTCLVTSLRCLCLVCPSIDSSPSPPCTTIDVCTLHQGNVADTYWILILLDNFFESSTPVTADRYVEQSSETHKMISVCLNREIDVLYWLYVFYFSIGDLFLQWPGQTRCCFLWLEWHEVQLSRRVRCNVINKVDKSYSIQLHL